MKSSLPLGTHYTEGRVFTRIRKVHNTLGEANVPGPPQVLQRVPCMPENACFL